MLLLVSLCRDLRIVRVLVLLLVVMVHVMLLLQSLFLLMLQMLLSTDLCARASNETHDVQSTKQNRQDSSRATDVEQVHKAA